jgi:hypothetical protein
MKVSIWGTPESRTLEDNEIALKVALEVRREFGACDRVTATHH